MTTHLVLFVLTLKEFFLDASKRGPIKECGLTTSSQPGLLVHADDVQPVRVRDGEPGERMESLFQWT